MLLVKTKIGPSKINGIGIFADQFIPKGAAVWKFQPGFDLKIGKEALKKLSGPAREQFLKYSYLDFQVYKGKYVLCFDDARFFNHSNNPNCVDDFSPDGKKDTTIAAKDIKNGEELTCDYESFDSNHAKKLCGR